MVSADGGTIGLEITKAVRVVGIKRKVDGLMTDR